MKNLEKATRQNFCDYTKDYLLNQLEDYKGCKSYACDLYLLLTEGINVDGSATYSTNEAKEYIKEWFEEAGKYYEYAKMNFGEVFSNPFENPEAFQVEMISQGVSSLLSQVETISDNWNEEIEITDELIKEIKKHIESIHEIEF